jgi:HAD superfamily hydrolase (TIGR01509 family)
MVVEGVSNSVTMTGLALPAGDFKAYLFDLDGTIADSMPLHYLGWKQAVEEHGGHFPEDLFYAWAGTPLPRTVEMLNERFGLSMPVMEVVHRKEDLYLSRLSDLRPIAEVVHHIRAQHGIIPFAIVSGSPRRSIVETLTRLDLIELFPVLVGAEDYTRGKPHPEPFLTAAATLGVAPADCLVFEDADSGIAAAEAAGMQWVRVPARVLGG